MSSKDSLSAEDRSCVVRMAQTIRSAILGADRAAEDDADRVARRVVDLMRAGMPGPSTLVSFGASAPAACSTATPPLLVGAKEAARLLGLSSVRALYSMMDRQSVPGVVRQGRALRFHRPTLVAWAARRAARR